jgi:hypothetical protein
VNGRRIGLDALLALGFAWVLVFVVSISPSSEIVWLEFRGVALRWSLGFEVEVPFARNVGVEPPPLAAFLYACLCTFILYIGIQYIRSQHNFAR